MDKENENMIFDDNDENAADTVQMEPVTDSADSYAQEYPEEEYSEEEYPGEPEQEEYAEADEQEDEVTEEEYQDYLRRSVSATRA